MSATRTEARRFGDGPNIPPLLRMFQLTDSFFPVGAFAYSDGLETATNAGTVHDAATLNDWLEHFVESVFVPLEGRALAQTMSALGRTDTATVRTVDEELTALRPSAESRRASTAVGRRVLSMYATIAPADSFAPLAALLTRGNAAAAYGAVFFHAGSEKPDALLAFGYGRLAGMASAAIRLMALGQEEAQRLLTRQLAALSGAVEKVLETEDAPLEAFSPGLDIVQMNHQYVYSRLFRS